MPLVALSLISSSRTSSNLGGTTRWSTRPLRLTGSTYSRLFPIFLSFMSCICLYIVVYCCFLCLLLFSFMKDHYTWSPDLEADVRRGFDQKAGIRLKDMHNYITKKKQGVRPHWMSVEVHRDMLRNAADADFQRRSQKAAQNRRGGNIDSPVQPSHCQGSVSATERARRLVSTLFMFRWFNYVLRFN